jgi:GTPase SAR1 family protein
MTAMAARYRRESDDGQSSDYARARPVAPDAGAINGFEAPPTLDELTDAMELGKGQQEIWEEIYKLGVSGVDKYIELPQIVVVGDQSSGKSSVLEAITGVPFPRNSGMCTKFPTQINLRKAPKSSFSVSLDPDLDRTEGDKARMSRFADVVRGETDLGVIVKRAEQTIWPHGQSANSASKDTLKLDFSGPKKDYLTLVDLPGIIHTNAGNVMGDEEVVAIRELAIDYMKNPRSIILAVISAANDLNLQMVATLARTIDPQGKRTLGVITKPDRIDSPESEDMFIKLAKNEIVKFDLGWHVLRNRSNSKEEKNCSPKERDLNEKRFFETSRWNVLDQSHLGIDALKTKMSGLLLQRFAEVIPHVVTQIETRLDICKRNLGDLGEGYGTVSQMRAKMQEWCKMSTDYVSNAAEGYYRDHYKTAFFESDAHDARIRKLRARINAENLRFEEELRTMGHTVEIADIHPPSPRRQSRINSSRFPIRMTRTEFIEKAVDPVIRESAGQELLGDSNPLLVYKMFQKQSQNWDAIATRHMSIISGICEAFVREVLDFVWPGTIQERIWSALIEDQLETRNEGANKEVQMLCKDRCRYAKSYDSEYTNIMKKWERKFMEVAGGPDQQPTLRPITPAEGYLARVLAYYESSSKVFMSNVIVQVIERHLVDSLQDIFDTSRVHDMEDERIKAIFEEDEHIRNSRAKLQAERATLEGGLKSARRLAARKDLKVVRNSVLDVESELTSSLQYDKAEPESVDLDTVATRNPQDATLLNPPLPSRPSRRPVTPHAETPDAQPPRAASTRSTNPYQQQYAPVQDASTPVHVNGYVDHQSPTKAHEPPQPAQRPPPVPPYVPQNARNGSAGYGPEAYTDERRFVVDPNRRR